MKIIVFIVTFVSFLNQPAFADQLALSYNEGFFAMIVGMPNDGKENFSYKPTNTEKEYFESDYKYRGLKLGGWKQVDGENLVQVNFVYAKGDFLFFGKDPVVEGRHIPASMLEMEVRGLVSFYEFQKVKFDFLGGLKVFKIFIPELNYNGRTHESHEDHNNSNFQITIGLGIRNIINF